MVMQDGCPIILLIVVTSDQTAAVAVSFEPDTLS